MQIVARVCVRERGREREREREKEEEEEEEEEERVDNLLKWKKGENDR